MTQEQLAKELNISRQSISKWELDISLPSILFIIQLTKILNCSIEDLLKNLE